MRKGKHWDDLCPRCLINTIETGSGYCRPCKNAYMREWRVTHPLTPEQRRRDNARSHAGMAVRRGQIKRQPCEVCAAEPAQMHHSDYSKPLDVTWLCKRCHRHFHKGDKS